LNHPKQYHHSDGHMKLVYTLGFPIKLSMLGLKRSE